MTTCMADTAAMPVDPGGCAGGRQAAFRGIAAEVVCTLGCFDACCRDASCRCPVIRRARLAHRHPGADFGAHLVDQLEAVLGFDMPESPAVAGAGALGHRADAVDRADL